MPDFVLIVQFTQILSMHNKHLYKHHDHGSCYPSMVKLSINKFSIDIATYDDFRVCMLIADCCVANFLKN